MSLFIEAAEIFSPVSSLIRQNSSVCAANLWGSSPEMLVSFLKREFPDRPMLFLLPGVADAERAIENIPFYLEKEAIFYPGFDSPPLTNEVSSLSTLGKRIEIISSLSAGKPLCIVSSIQATQQPTPDKKTLDSSFLSINEGDFFPPEELIRWLINAGFRRERMVERIGDFAVRGGIIDVFPLLADDPIRMEFFGDDIESIRFFDLTTQRSRTEVGSAMIRGLEARKLRRNWQKPESDNIFSYLPSNTLLICFEPHGLIEAAATYYTHHKREAPGIADAFSIETLFQKFQRVEIERLVLTDSKIPVIDCEINSLKRFEVDVDAAMDTLRNLALERKKTIVVCHNEAEEDRLNQLLRTQEMVKYPETVIGRVSGGFDSPKTGLLLVADSEVFNRFQTRRRKTKKFKGVPLSDLVDIKPGNLVVHLTHGIAMYEGLQSIEKEGRKAEFMRLKFASDIRIFVPLANIDLVQKFIGGHGDNPPLSTIGGVAWEKRKKAVEESVKDFAQELLTSLATRKASEGIAQPMDSDWQRKFEASFPYEETDDQISSVAEIKLDQQRPVPMDRLLCGDVGFGKTEVVIRAAFKAVLGGTQVAVVVPTTVLAEQHFRTFKERMAAYPVNIQVISRFKTRAQQREIIAGLKTGVVDIVVGTHRLFSKDVGFKSLGLVVIDEEHKFGVEHKETLKKFRINVDVLSLSATPIPRTLHMALVGIREVSNLYTPPAERLPIVTRVARFDKEVVRRAIIRELDRNGQVFFLHNRVQSIYRIGDLISRYVPEAKIGIGHGQMGEKELEEVMLKFLNKKIDVLLCTTIIESGIDIPNANTILINEADHFGLASLHQLRGRIGRYKHQGYCYLLIPGNRTLSSTGRERLKAIQEFSDLGAGYQLAMRDLEIRGSGNILGKEQSGFINSIGYDLYCKLLEKSVKKLKGEKPEEKLEVLIDVNLDAFFPTDFPLDDNAKIRLYRRLIRLKTEDELNDLKSELIDVYGPLPKPVLNLIETQRLKFIAQKFDIYRISLEENGISLRFRKFSLKRVEKMLGSSVHLVAGMLDDGIILRITNKNFVPEKKLEILKRILSSAESSA